MRKKYALLLLFPLVLSACCKEKPKPTYPIAGAPWQEVKLRIYHESYHGLIFNDTTYTRSAFDFLDYVQFFNDGRVDRASHYAVSLLNGVPNSSFTPWRSLYLIDYTGFNADTVYYNGHDTLRIHSFQNNGLFYDEMDAYYTRIIY